MLYIYDIKSNLFFIYSQVKGLFINLFINHFKVNKKSTLLEKRVNWLLYLFYFV